MSWKMPSLNIRLCLLTSLLVVVAIGLFSYFLTRGRGILGFQSPVLSLQHFMLRTQAEDLFGKSNLRVLVIGLDYDYDNQDQESSKNSRSDVIMALNLDLHRHRISELSIPRDMIAILPTGQRAKINQAQSEGGITESQHVVANWLGIPNFDRYIMLRINTAHDLIDAIGGLHLNVQNSYSLKGQGPNGPLDYDDTWGHLHIHLKPGNQHLNGEQAVGYARFRHDWCSDPCRIMRQQQVLRALADKIEHEKFNTFSHLQQILAVIHKDIDTNFTMKEELATAWSFGNLKMSDIHTAQVPYVETVMLPDYGDSLIPDEAAKKHLVATFFSNDNLRTGIHVHIENGTNTPRLATRVAEQLRQKGFIIDDVSDASSSNVEITEIHIDVKNPDASYLVRAALGQNASTAAIVSSTASDASTDPGVRVVLGRDILGPAVGTNP